MNTVSPEPALASHDPFDRRALIVLLLSVAGGSVDAMIILGFNVLTAAQTGNTILFAVSLAQGHFANGFLAAISVFGYLVGAAAGALAVDRRGSARWRIEWALVLELIALCLLLGSWRLAGRNPGTEVSAVLIGIAAVAMGIQSAYVLRLHVGLTTTYVTGTLTTFATKAMSGLHHLERTPAVAEEKDGNSAILWSSKGPLIYGLDWLVYFGGAFVGGVFFLRVHEAALVLPIIVVVAGIVVGVHRR